MGETVHYNPKLDTDQIVSEVPAPNGEALLSNEDGLGINEKHFTDM